MTLRFFNTLTSKTEEFAPHDPNNVTMYVCGPTVYQRPHIGNIRSVVVYDVLFRLLRHLYPAVTYVRNITDVDDKIIQKSQESLLPISVITQTAVDEFHSDCDFLNCLSPSVEPRVTDEIEQILKMISVLVKNGFAYQKNGNVMFSVKKFSDYGALSKQNIDQNILGSRIEININKDNPHDFVLWKPSEQPYGFDSEFGYGRPGWHIECSAISTRYLGPNFDIHGGGADLQFPHHENEIAQSKCTYSNSTFATTWIHNGFLTYNGQKMSKSLGNVITIQDLKHKNVHPDVIRFAMLLTSYRKPIDFSDSLLGNARDSIKRFYEALQGPIDMAIGEIPSPALMGLMEDLNTSVYIAHMFSVFKDLRAGKDPKGSHYLKSTLYKMGRLIGLFENLDLNWISEIEEIPQEIQALLEERLSYKRDKNYSKADQIKQKIVNLGYDILDHQDKSVAKKIK